MPQETGSPTTRAEVSTTLDKVRRLVGPKDTSTTLAPGQMSFGSVDAMFEILLEWKDLPGTLPYRALGADELAWLADAEPEITVSEAKGYELASGDLAILFYYDPSLRTDEDIQLAEERLTRLVRRQYPDSSDIAHATLPYIDDYGYVLISEDPDGESSSLLKRARTGPVPPDR